MKKYKVIRSYSVIVTAENKKEAIEKGNIALNLSLSNAEVDAKPICPQCRPDIYGYCPVQSCEYLDDRHYCVIE